MIVPLILCGGSGTRLWPLSRKSYPKQFSRLNGAHSLFQDTVLRVSGAEFGAPIVVTHADFRFVVSEQLAAVERGAQAILLEPEGRNTAPAVLAGALQAAAQDPDAVILMTPSDHAMPDHALFHEAVNAAMPAVAAGDVVTFGVRPTRAETGYGWLELSGAADDALQPLKSFVEKPVFAHAQALFEGGQHLWNAGIVLASAQSLIRAFEAHQPEILESVRAALKVAVPDLGFQRLDPESWAKAESISLDYAILEKLSNLSVMPYHGHWSDLGDWSAVWRETPTDETGVACHGPAFALECENVLLRAEAEGQTLVGLGVSDIIAVAMRDAVLVAHKDHAQEVKQVVDRLKVEGLEQAETHMKDFRPWGWFESLARGGRFQVKRIVVKPGAALSLQSHHHRAEHWVVVEGTAKVVIDEDEKLVGENQSVYIPLGARHRLENPGKMPMVLIEIQTGSYLGEDDIIRYEDLYARPEQGG